MVRGSPRHSQSNGGIERTNLTVENKLGAWMKDNNSTKWSVGCKIVQWRINTQINRAVGNKTPYYLAFGQKPRVGISNLPLSEGLLNSLSNERQLNRTFDNDDADDADNNDADDDDDEDNNGDNDNNNNNDGDDGDGDNIVNNNDGDNNNNNNNNDADADDDDDLQYW